VVFGTQERELCAVDCLAAYMDLTASRRTREGANIPDRLLLSLYAHTPHTPHTQRSTLRWRTMDLINGSLGRDEEENGVLDENAVSKLLEEVLVEAGINPQSPEGLHPTRTPSISL
jgi:hypothetical protein